MIAEKLELYQELYHKNKEIEQQLAEDNIETVIELLVKKQELIEELDGFNLAEEIKDEKLLVTVEELLKKINVLEEKNIKTMEEKKISIRKELARIRKGKKNQKSYSGYGSQSSGGRIIDRKR
ncbi:hypothetical protein MWH28_01430 [Natroniella sulfidigena]|uniref:hypothetical protein n=1 Tax=Natroniella sulfidigena TaxID=723921 RepID=UPI00200A33A4|nr:hypothetical protein [Natroniella sulfidigena]MCK8816025.1 hypothetical protein [Natroniella sulfidigena]